MSTSSVPKTEIFTLCVYPDSYAAVFAKEHDIPFIYITDLASTLVVRFDVEDFSSLKGLNLTVYSGENKVTRTIGDETEYRFKNIVPGSTCRITVTNRFGDVIAEKDNVAVSTFETTAVIDSVTEVVGVQARILGRTVGEDGKEKWVDYSDQVSITWVDENESVVATGKKLGVMPVGRKLVCRTVLGSALGKVYRAPEDAGLTVEHGHPLLAIRLQEFESCTVTGTILTEEGEPLQNASVIVTQKLNGKYEKATTAVAGSDGKFSLQIPDADAEFEISCRGYKTEVLSQEISGDTDLGDIVLREADGYRISVNAQYRQSAADGNGAEAVRLENLSDLSFTIYDETDDREIEDFTVHGTEITLNEDVDTDDSLVVSAASRSADFAAVSGTVAVSEETGELTLSIVEYGKAQIAITSSENESNRILAYDSNGAPAWSTETKDRNVLSSTLPDGKYSIVVIGSSKYVAVPADLSMYKDTGLTKDRDYSLRTVTVKAGTVSTVSFASVPAFDETRFYYTDAGLTSFYVNKTHTEKTQYVTLYATAPFLEEYDSRVRNVKWVIDLPEGLALTEGTVSIDGSRIDNYEQNNGRLSVQAENTTGKMRMCLAAAEEGDWEISGYLQFTVNGKTVLQPVGTAAVSVGAYPFSFELPDKTMDEVIPLSGQGPANAKIEFYDNGFLVAKTTTSYRGNWACDLPLHMNSANTYRNDHSIYAMVTPPYGSAFQSAADTVTYLNIENRPSVRSVDMLYYRGSNWWDAYSVDTITFDFAGSRITSSDGTAAVSKGKKTSFSYNPSYTYFRFVTNFDGDAGKVSNVKIAVNCTDGKKRVLKAEYSDGQFYSSALPTSVSVYFDCESETIFSREETEQLKAQWEEAAEAEAELNNEDIETELEEIEELISQLRRDQTEAPEDAVPEETITKLERDYLTLKRTYVSYTSARNRLGELTKNVSVTADGISYSSGSESGGSSSFTIEKANSVPSEADLITDGFEKIQASSGKEVWQKQVLPTDADGYTVIPKEFEDEIGTGTGQGGGSGQSGSGGGDAGQPGTTPGSNYDPKASFLYRNRIVAGLADIVVVVEAAEKSGSLNTAAHALEQGKEVFAVPGNITNPYSQGCNKLIRQGANPYTGPDDLLRVLFPEKYLKKRTKSTQALLFGDTEEETAILLALSKGLRNGEEIMQALHLSASDFNQIVTLLEIKGQIRSLGANNWSLS